MRALVTGAAGFIGSHLCDRLLADGWQVTGVDAFTDYYPRHLKERNLEAARLHPNFRLVEVDLVDVALETLIVGVDVVFHLAARPGVRASWGPAFEQYLHDNVLASQRLFEAASREQVGKLVYASSSSVYGDAACYPTGETVTPQPISPYGMTKLATEQLAALYAKSGLPAVGLRLFTVYGERQRPDMFFHLLCRSVIEGRSIEVFGDGNQSREFTYVGDVVDAFVAAAASGRPDEVYNVGGGGEVSVNETIATLEAISGRTASVRYTSRQAGDARRTAADISKARRELGFAPNVPLREGLEREYRWLEMLVTEDTATAMRVKAFGASL
ncbi:MAG: NAD-dependent epimerase/dehydratase family protein [Dehalococcoidia bacterium]